MPLDPSDPDWWERETDAGTRPLMPIPPPVDDIPYDEELRDD